MSPIVDPFAELERALTELPDDPTRATEGDLCTLASASQFVAEQTRWITSEMQRVATDVQNMGDSPRLRLERQALEMAAVALEEGGVRLSRYAAVAIAARGVKLEPSERLREQEVKPTAADARLA
jgi:hypothetical protein